MNAIIQIRTLFLLLLLFTLSACGGGGASSGAGTGSNSNACNATSPVFTGPNVAGTITFTSVTPSSYANLLDACNSLEKVNVTGTLYLPAGAVAAVPAMIIGHGSNGISSKQTDWANFLNGIGIAAFVVDSYSARSVTNGQSVSSAVEVADALFALAVLAALPQIDSSRIGIMEFGAGAGINTAFTEIKNSVVTSNNFVVHVVLYANCNIRQMSANISTAPILMLHGQADDWNAPADCLSFSNVLNTVNGNVTFRSYPGAWHGFDSTGTTPIYSATTRSNTGCAGEFRVDTRTLRNFKTGAVYAGNTAYQNYLDSCRTNGVNSAGNTAARTAARTEVNNLLKSVFGL